MSRHIEARARKPEFLATGLFNKRSSKNPDSRRVELYLHKDLFANLQAMALADGLSVSSLVRGLVCDGLAVRQKSGGAP